MRKGDADRQGTRLPESLPPHWRIELVPTDEPAPDGALVIDAARGPASADGVDAAALLYGERGLAPWGRSSFPIGEATIVLDRYPTLDEVWTLWVWAHAEGGGQADARWDPVGRYVADVRLGYLTDRVPPASSVQAIHQSIVLQTLVRERPDIEAFLESALGLCRTVAGRLTDGASLLDDDLVAGEPALERFRQNLLADERLYREDRARGRVFEARVPASHHAGAPTRELALLVLHQPAAAQFKLWARRDAEAPGGDGFPLLLVELDPGNVVLSADPTSQARVGFLAAPLTDAERRARGSAPGSGSDAGADHESAWYDGERHEGTLVAAPHGGTKLSLDDVVAAIGPPLSLRRAGPARLRAAPAVAGGIAVAAIGIAAVAGWAFRSVGPASDPGLPTGPADVRGSKGDPLAKERVITLLGDEDEGPRTFERYALLVGVADYPGDRALHSPWQDARRLRDLLVDDYGYRTENVEVFLDEPATAESDLPTAERIKKAVEDLGDRIGDVRRSSFLFYYSGHGGYVKGARRDFGTLQPHAFDTSESQPLSHRGWDMQRILVDITKSIESNHLLLLLDCCYGGWAGAKGPGELSPEVTEYWDETARAIMTAGTRGQQAWEDDPHQPVWDGHSAFTRFVIEGLTVEPGGLAIADENEDRVVTDEELHAFVRARVPGAVLDAKSARQEPQLVRVENELPRSGKFLFIPD